MMQSISVNRPDGKTCSGYYAEPAAGSSAPGVVIIQEWWGVNQQIKGVGNRLAAAGYRTLIPDLYRGKSGVEVQEAEHLMNNLNFGDAASQDIRGAVQHLKSTGGRTGVIGFCMGGALTLLSAVTVPEADAFVCWYGFPPLEYIDAAKITAPLQGHFAIEDAFFPIQQVDELEKKLQQAGANYDFHRYHAQHAFGNETALNMPIPAKYDAAAAELAWQRTLEFLKEHLG
jgi:carboxymethylenebutenolidase